MLRLNNIKIYEDISDDELLEFAIKKFKVKKADVLEWHIVKKSIDARKKNDVHYNYTIDVKVKDESAYPFIDKSKEKDFSCLINISEKNKLLGSPIIIGAGPAGLFAALTFIENGICPIILEQGKTVEERKKDVDNFSNGGKLNTFSNIQFGEGGAGTFSDGKLTTGINSPFCAYVLRQFVKFGAPEQILYLAKPHIGTDNLLEIVKNIRNYIISKGGKFYFNTKVIDFNISNGKIKSVLAKNLIDGSINEFISDNVILAIGHSSRDTFRKIYEKNFLIEPKNFSVGLRIEHLQSDINKTQYGTSTSLNLPPSEYKLAYHNNSTGRSCYTFCMCPGGFVMASNSDDGEIVTNGMSRFLRDGINANSAILVNVTPDDFDSSSPLAGVDFQKRLEQKAFVLGGSNYYAPIQRVEDFLKDQKSNHIGKVLPTYMPGTTLSNLNEILPDFVSSTLKEAINYFDSKLNCFAEPDSILTGVETRSSSPIRILRNENLNSNITGIYPCGEGAGYAGGIMSAAVDGIKCAVACIKN